MKIGKKACFRGALLLLVPLGFVIGISVQWEIWTLGIVAALLQLACACCAGWCMEIVFGYHRQTRGQVAVDFFVSFMLLGPAGICHGWTRVPEQVGAVVVMIFAVCTVLSLLLGCRHGVTVAVIMVMSGEIADIHSKFALYQRIAAAPCCLLLIVTLSAQMAKDQHMLTMLGFLVYLPVVIGGHLAAGKRQALLGLVILALFVYAFILLERRQRYLPAGLAGAKFIKLSYLRKSLQSGTPISRCQDLPEDAFGMPTRAASLIITSHRWLDRLTCDSPDGCNPCGLRLTTMVDRLDKIFVAHAIIRGRGLYSRWQHIRASLTGGVDVLIFFDFMSVPQTGIDAHGNVVGRSPEEDAMFQQFIPNMSTLYATFNVIVLPEVSEGAHPYEESGWCFSEVMISSLGRRLAFFSPEFSRLHFAERISLANCSEFIRAFEEELSDKRFFVESDRKVVDTLVKDYFQKRCLVDAIQQKNSRDVDAICAGYSGKRLQAMLDGPTDDLLDTPLHLAVKCGAADVAKTLLAHGADPQLRNLRGDAPTQWFFWPRCQQASRLCRQATARTLRASLTDQDEQENELTPSDTSRAKQACDDDAGATDTCQVVHLRL